MKVVLNMKKSRFSIGKIVALIVSVLLVISVVTVIGVSYQLQGKVLYPNHAQTVALPPELAGRVTLEFDELTPNYEKFAMTMQDGYNLEAAIIPAATASDKYVVLVHGITRNLSASMKLYPIFHDLGYNVVMFSLRNHGNNADDITTYGSMERADLDQVIDYLQVRYGDDIHLGIHGISMGASIALQYAGSDDSAIDFVISDCAYTSAIAELNVQLDAQYPALAWFPFVETTAFLTTITHGSAANLDYADSLAVVPNIEVPVFFIHGLADDFIPVTDAVELYQAKTTGIRELWLVPDAGHDDALETDFPAYEAAIREFVQHAEHIIIQ